MLKTNDLIGRLKNNLEEGDHTIIGRSCFTVKAGNFTLSFYSPYPIFFTNDSHRPLELNCQAMVNHHSPSLHYLRRLDIIPFLLLPTHPTQTIRTIGICLQKIEKKLRRERRGAVKWFLHQNESN